LLFQFFGTVGEVRKKRREGGEEKDLLWLQAGARNRRTAKVGGYQGKKKGGKRKGGISLSSLHGRIMTQAEEERKRCLNVALFISSCRSV